MHPKPFSLALKSVNDLHFPAGLVLDASKTILMSYKLAICLGIGFGRI